MAKKIIEVKAKVIYEWEVEVDNDNFDRNKFQLEQEKYFEALMSCGLEDKHFSDIEVDWI